jgi:tryptophan-rich sensory protein
VSTTTHAALHHPVAALAVGLVWLVAAFVFVLVVACLYACGVAAAAAVWGHGKWVGRYRGSHRVSL